MYPQIKLAILNNIVPPYRLPIYIRLGKVFTTSVILSGKEDNELRWKGVEIPLIQNNISVKIAKGFSFRFKNKTKDGKTYEKRNLHINPGYFIDLVREKPDVVISTEMGFRTIMALIYGYLYKKPIWVWWGGTHHTEQNRIFLKQWVRKLVVSMTKHWISYGKTSTEYLIKIGVKREKILQIQNCVDEELYCRPTQPKFEYDLRPVLLLAGQFVARKGISQYLEAAARLQKKGYQFTSILVGDGPEKKSLQAMVTDLKIESIYFVSPHSTNMMPAVYRSADVFVFPTLEDVWGLVINEALWSGTPVISSIYAGCTEEIVPPENRFDPLDPEDFERALKLAIEDTIKPADTKPLLTCDEVAQRIINDILKTFHEGNH